MCSATIQHLTTDSAIAGVEIHTLNPNFDERGGFTDFYRGNWNFRIAPAQWSLVQSKARVRGMHYHVRHDELFMLVKGYALVGLYDLREDSPTFGVSSMFEFHEARPEVLVFPRQLVHG